MRLVLFAAIAFWSNYSCFAQNTFTTIVRDADTREPLPGASVVVAGTAVGATANAEGIAEIRDVPNGAQVIEFTFIGYRSQTARITFPLDIDTPYEVFLHPEHEELHEIVISTTRGTRTVADIPTRIEFIAGEELDEKGNMKPGDIRMLLNESTGIQTQQTSATSANASIRIQGLDGRYTQILKDGLPLYAGFSGGLGLLQTPPLDLKQVEVIKGATSTLYGGGAIAGLVNLISREPTEEGDLRFMINGTSAKGLDLSGFYGHRFGKAGVTVFASRNTNEPYDPADIGLTAIPKFTRYSVNPKLFLTLAENTRMRIGINFTTENRIGGDIRYIQGDGDATHSYFENNESTRYSTEFTLTHRLKSGPSLTLKNSINHFDRLLSIPTVAFGGVQNSTFTEFNYLSSRDRSEWVAGLNAWTDDFSEMGSSVNDVRDYTHTTFGAFIQNTLSASDRVSFETGLRADYVVDYGFALLPRVSVLFKASPKFSSRIGGGFGYKTPTIFTEESERIQFQNVLPVSPGKNVLERSYGANWDVNYRTEIGGAGFSVNHLFFYTYLDRPLMLTSSGNNRYELVNLSGFTDSKGTETNVKVEFGDFKLFIGYTFTDTRIHEGSAILRNPLTARHRLNNVLMYEIEEKWKVGLEAYYFGEQRLTDNTYGKDYWICGFMLEKLWERFSLFINFENFLDTRQTRFDTIYTGSISNPVFRDIYAPVDGFVVNGGLKVNL